MKKRINIIISTYFYLGYSPVAPGTAGTLGAVPLFYLLSFYLSNLQYLAASLLIIIIAIAVSSEAVKIFNKQDPNEVVIDEVAGFLVAMAFINPTILNVVLGFFLFRVFDIFKPFPCRTMERLRGGYGIVMDDIAAGIWTNISLIVINYILIN